MGQEGLVCVLAAVGLIAGCASNGEGHPKPMSQLEMRNLQTRAYETKDTRMVMKAVVNVLQDQGFIVKHADMNLGLLTAEKWSDIIQPKKEVKRAKKKGTVLPKNLVLECTANVSEHGNQSRVRVTFQKKLLDPAGGVMQATVVNDPAFYQRFFADVGKGVFLQQEGV